MDYGAVVGQPAIRGLLDGRVKILRNGLSVADVAGMGADHLNEVDLNNVSQVEIIRGPSSLLYKKGSIGGVINVIDKEKHEEIKKIRDRSIILIGFSGGFRRKEIVSLNYEDLDFVEEGLKINLRRSKTDQFGEGTLKALPYFENSIYCPVVSIQKWLKVSNINAGPLFRRFTKGSKLTGNRLTDQSVALFIKEYLEIAGIDSTNYSGHSLRSGFATVAAEAGADERSIMAMTGHKTTQMVRRYIRDANLFKNNALNKINL